MKRELQAGLMIALSLDATMMATTLPLGDDDDVLPELAALGYVEHSGGGYKLTNEGIRAAAAILIADNALDGEADPKAAICTVCHAFNCPCAIRAREECLR